MEYSVYDLIRILLRKWYVILISMCALGGLSVITVQTSYDLAVQNYEKAVSETVSVGVDTGTLSATFLYGYELSDSTKNLAETSQKAAALFTDDRVLKETQTAMDAYHYVEPPVLGSDEKIIESYDPLNIANHFSVVLLPDRVVRITISGLEERPARELLLAYLRVLGSVGNSDYSIQVNMTEQENVFTLDPLRLSQSAKFAQVVMAKPEKAPIAVRNIATTAAYAFVFSCFLILVVTFVRDSRRASKTGRTM